MPVYEYTCASCGTDFEELVLGSEIPSCPECSGVDLQKRFSAFAVRPDGVAPESPAADASCGTCGDPRGPGACSLN